MSGNGQLLKDVTRYGDLYRYNKLSNILFYSSDRTIAQYKKMRMHPVVWAGLNFIKLGLGNVPPTFESDSEDVKEVCQKVFMPIWNKLIKDAGECLDYGFKAMEIRYKAGSVKYECEEVEKSFYGTLLRQPKSLDPETIEILVQGDGSFLGFRQDFSTEVLAEQMKALVFTNHLESGQFYGISAMEPIYQYWYDSNLLRQFSMRWLERKGVGILRGWYPPGKQEGGTDNQDIMLTLLGKIVEGVTVALPGTTDVNGNRLWDIGILDSEDRTDAFINRMKYNDDRILLGLLIPEKALTQSDVGSFASVSSFQNMFLQRKQAFLDELVDSIDKYMLQNFVKINFGDNVYCKVTPGQLSDASKDSAFALTDKLAAAGVIKIKSEWLQKKTGIEIEEEEEIAQPEQYEIEEANKPGQDPEKMPVRKMAEAGNRWQNMTDREKKFKLNELSSEFDNLSADLQAALVAEAQSQFGRISKYISKNYGMVKNAKIVSGVEINRNPFKAILKDYISKIYDTAYNQFGQSIGVNLAEYGQSEFIGMRADLSADNIKATLEKNIKYQIGNLFSTGTDAGLADLMNSILDEFEINKVQNISETEIGFVISQSNQDFFDATNKAVKKGLLPEGDEIQRFQASAVMDNKVCPLCEKINGTIVRAGSAVMNEYKFPLHYLCRCVWLPITRQEIENPGSYSIQGPGGSYPEIDLTMNDKGRPVSVNDMTLKIGADVKLKTFCECG